MIRNVLLCSLISMFFCSRAPHPSPTCQNLTLTTHGNQAELADTSTLIIRCPPTSKLGTEEQITLMECEWGQVKGSAGFKEAPWCHSCPLGSAASFKSICWQKSDNNFGSCTVFCLAAEIIFTERTSLLIKPSILFERPVMFCSFLLFGLSLHARNSFRREFRARY